MLSINSHDSFPQLWPKCRMLDVNLVSTPVLLQLLMHAFHGLLGLEAQPILLFCHYQELVNMSLQNVDLERIRDAQRYIVNHEVFDELRVIW